MGKTPINEMEPIVIEDWLAELGRGDSKLQNGTRLKMRNIMSVVFRHGIRHGFLPRDAQANPVKYVRQSGRSSKEHTILAQEQAMAILTHLKEPVRTMAWLDATTGLRVSELLALRWVTSTSMPVSCTYSGASFTTLSVSQRATLPRVACLLLPPFSIH